MKCNSSLKNRLWAARPQLPKSTTLKQVKFIHRDPHFYTRRVQVTQAIHLRLHPHNINRESRTEISEVWMLTIKKTQQLESDAATYHRGDLIWKMHQSRLWNSIQSQLIEQFHSFALVYWGPCPTEKVQG